jgi:hypothetical protein
VLNLHESKKYDRIVLVGHSLGTVIGYDILTELWARFNDGYENPTAEAPTPALEAIESLCSARRGPNFSTQYQEAQAPCAAELRERGNKWIVSDFVTMGSPLAHAKFLMARNDKAFVEKKTQREFPTCPPELEIVSGRLGFSYIDRDGIRIPHYAAVFGPTRWTNLYFPCRLTVFGDVIGGPVAKAFGAGIRDIPVHTSLQWGIFTHTLYWRVPKTFDEGAPPSHIKELRSVLSL